MKILIAADMEGITGVVSWDHVDPEHAEYQRFRKMMTADVNAAVCGAYLGGASAVTVTDGHWGNRNILIEELEERATLQSGGTRPLAMVQGVEAGVAGVCFVGYHARAGAQQAVLDHTWSDTIVANLRLNGQTVGEIGLNAAVCGHFNVPVVMISGDQTACKEALELLGGLEVAAVKQAHGRMAADCLPPVVSQRRICEAAARAVARLAAGTGAAPFRPALPVVVEIEFMQSDMADRASLVPGSRRGADRNVQFEASDMLAAYNAFRTMCATSRS